MRKFLLLALIFLVFSCGPSYKINQVIKLTEDIPAADTKYNMETVKKSVGTKDKKEAMELFYLGHAFIIEKGEKIVIGEIKGDYACVKNGKNWYWVYLPFVNDGK